MELTNNNTIKTKRFLKIVFWIFTGILAALFFASVFAVAVTYLWNWLMPGIFGLKTITYLQAFGLVLLTRLLVGGWHRDHDKHGHEHFHKMFSKNKTGSSDVNSRFDEFWEKEGREAFRKYVESR